MSWLNSHFWSMIWISASALTFFLTHAFMRYFQCQCFLHSTIDVCKSMGILLECAIESVSTFRLQKITSKMYRSMTHIYFQGKYCFWIFLLFCFRKTGMKIWKVASHLMKIIKSLLVSYHLFEGPSWMTIGLRAFYLKSAWRETNQFWSLGKFFVSDEWCTTFYYMLLKLLKAKNNKKEKTNWKRNFERVVTWCLANNKSSFSLHENCVFYSRHLLADASIYFNRDGDHCPFIILTPFCFSNKTEFIFELKSPSGLRSIKIHPSPSGLKTSISLAVLATIFPEIFFISSMFW